MTSTIYGIAMFFAAIDIPAAMIKYVAEFKNDRTKLNQIASSGVITSLFLGIGFIALFYFSSGLFANIFNMPGLSRLIKLLSPVFPFALVGGALLGLVNGLREMKKYAEATILQTLSWLMHFLIGTCREYFEITLEGYRQTTRKLLGFGFGAQIFRANASQEYLGQGKMGDGRI